MARDLIILFSVLIFIFLESFIIGSIVSDPIFEEISTNNISYNTQNLAGTNFSETDITSGDGALETIGIMFSFQITEDDDFPAPLQNIIAFVNWMLLLLIGVLIFRLARHGGG